jgi:osmotically-inducible protein OsmY
MTTTLSNVDRELTQQIERQLQWDPDVDATAVAVAAADGAVTLSGFIDSYAGKLAAERAAKHVHGVRAVANEIQVRAKVARADDLIAHDVAAILKGHVHLPQSVQAVVRGGHVSLSGTVQWLAQRTAAELAVRHVRGVVDITNHITVVPSAVMRDVQHRITEALHRMADINARNVHVEVAGDVVKLTGSVSTWAQRDKAERAAAHAPGITHVENLLRVVPSPL